MSQGKSLVEGIDYFLETSQTPDDKSEELMASMENFATAIEQHETAEQRAKTIDAVRKQIEMLERRKQPVSPKLQKTLAELEAPSSPLMHSIELPNIEHVLKMWTAEERADFCLGMRQVIRKHRARLKEKNS